MRMALQAHIRDGLKTARVHFVHLVIVSGIFAIAESSRLGVRLGSAP